MTDLSDMNPEFVRKNAELLKAQGVDVPEYLQPDDPNRAEKREYKLEKHLQADVENWLRLHGYYRRSPSDITLVSKAPRGWQVHVNKAKKNPLMLDILLLGNDGRFLEFELKVPPVKYSSDEQKILCEQYFKPVIVSLEGAMDLVKRWEKRGE